MNLNQQLAFLRKEKGITQEELAIALGVTNQAVSKWENGQNCPDIQLLPMIADYFNISIDDLMGHTSVTGAEELILNMRSLLNDTAEGADFALGVRIAFALHGALLTKYLSNTKTEGINSEALFSESMSSEEEKSWGISALNVPEITSIRRGGSVFYSSNKNLKLDNAYLRHIAAVFREFSDIINLKTFKAVFYLTRDKEDAYVSVEEIAEESGLPAAKIENVLENELYEYFSERTENGNSLWRIKGCHMHLLPLIAMFGEHN